MARQDTLRARQDLAIPEAGTYEIDPSHSAVEFVTRHLGLAKVRGRFNQFSGTILIGDDPLDSRVDVVIDAGGIDTRDATRDEHLRSPDFLDVARHPTLEFHSTGVDESRPGGGSIKQSRPGGGSIKRGDTWSVEGDLTVRGKTRPVTLDVEFEGAAEDPWGNARIGTSATTEINREDFGLTWNQALETGGWLVGKQVRIELSVEAVKK